MVMINARIVKLIFIEYWNHQENVYVKRDSLIIIMMKNVFLAIIHGFFFLLNIN